MQNLHPVVMNDGFKNKLVFTPENVNHVSNQHQVELGFTNHRGIAKVEGDDLIPIIVSGIDDLADGISRIHRRLIALESENGDSSPSVSRVSLTQRVQASAPPLYPDVPKIAL
jgi:hypothetical protein